MVMAINPHTYVPSAAEEYAAADRAERLDLLAKCHALASALEAAMTAAESAGAFDGVTQGDLDNAIALIENEIQPIIGLAQMELEDA